MGYPTSNLKKNFEDINTNNRVAVQEYSDALKKAIDTGDFSDVSNIYNKYKDTLDKVIINAEVLNELTNYVENLRNYTIAYKKQLFFVDEYARNQSDFDNLDESLSEGDILVVTEKDSPKAIKHFEEKQASGEYYTIAAVPSKSIYGDTSISMGRVPATIIGNNSFAMGDNVQAAGDNSFAFGKLLMAVGENQMVIGRSNIPSSSDLFIVGNGMNANKSNAFAVDKDGNGIFKGNVISNGKNLTEAVEDTGWVECKTDNNYTTSYEKNTAPQVRRIGNVVHLRGVITGNRPSKVASFPLPSELFYPSKNELFISPIGYLDSDLNFENNTNVELGFLNISSDGNVVFKMSDDSIIAGGTPINCNTTWFVD